MSNPLGVILAGGLSRRMGGNEKSFLDLNGKTLISHVCDHLIKQVPDIIINANGDASRFTNLKKPVVVDTVEGYAGPLAGILAAMRWAQENHDASQIITVAADTPFFPDGYTQKMQSQFADTNSNIALATSNGNRHPVFGMWRVDLAEKLEAFLVDENQRKVMLFVQRHAHCFVEFNGNDPDPFFNINTPDDLETARKFTEESKTA
ncbi:MAG: molybdenum cofactor guanylyltransferase MobA [Pseudomonadota bacterium]